MDVSSDAEDLAAVAMSDGKGLQHVSGARSKSSLRPEDIDGGQQLTESHDQVSLEAKINSTHGQDPSQDSDRDAVADGSSGEDDIDCSQEWMQAMIQDMAKDINKWPDEGDAMNEWALHVPGNMFDDCPVFD